MAKHYGKVFRDGIWWYHRYPWWQRPIYGVVSRAQWLLWRVGVPWHNRWFDECTPDGDCCRSSE